MCVLGTERRALERAPKLKVQAAVTHHARVGKNHAWVLHIVTVLYHTGARCGIFQLWHNVSTQAFQVLDFQIRDVHLVQTFQTSLVPILETEMGQPGLQSKRLGQPGLQKETSSQKTITTNFKNKH